MRILFLSNYYPPYELGGYEQNCYEVAERLKQRGHQIFVVTSNYLASGKKESGVYRVLNTDLDLRPHRGTWSVINRTRRLAQSQSKLKLVIGKTMPEIVFVWGMGNLPRALLREIEERPDPPVVYYISDYWPISPDFVMVHLRAPSKYWLVTKLKEILVRFFLRHFENENLCYRPRFENVICVSRAVKERFIRAGLPFEQSKVIHNGIDVEPFLKVKPNLMSRVNSPLKIIYAGRISPEKGLETAIAGLGKALTLGIDATLTIVGRGDLSYVQSLRTLAAECGLEDKIMFRAWIDWKRMPNLLSEFDIFISPSTWEEPLSLSVQKAMVTGLVVISTPVGGMPELIINGENGLFFTLEDSDELAIQLGRLASNPDLYMHLAKTGRQTILDRFTISRMVDEIEQYLQAVLTRSHGDVW